MLPYCSLSTSYTNERTCLSPFSSFTVINDIVRTLFSKTFMDELLKPQQLYSHRTLKTVLTRLAHASIMRLNPASMDRVRTTGVTSPVGLFCVFRM